MDLMIILLAVVLATAIVIAYLLFIWWLDRYEREPFWVVLLTFLWGGIGGTGISCFVNSLTGLVLALGVGLATAQTLTTVVVAPIVEEFVKALVFVFLVLVGNQLDNRTDGLIYGAATGLGFACVENLYYYWSVYNPESTEVLFITIFTRTAFTALVHCISSALLGMAIGYARHGKGASRWVLWPVLGYVLAVFNHATWNGLTSIAQGVAESNQGLSLLTMLFSILLVVGASIMMFLLTLNSLNSEHKVIKRFLLEEAQRGVLPREHAEIIPYWIKRRKSGWLSAQVPKEAYVKAATLLAFRHYQLERADGDRKAQYLHDIQMYRQQVQDYMKVA